MTSADLPAPLESAAASSSLHPVTQRRLRPARGYAVASLRARKTGPSVQLLRCSDVFTSLQSALNCELQLIIVMNNGSPKCGNSSAAAEV